MNMPIDLESQLPVYRKIENWVKHLIEEKGLKRHDMLPSENAIAAEHGVSVGTVRKALNKLEVENVIYRRHGKGTFVSPRMRKQKLLVVAGTDGCASYTDTSADSYRFLLGALKASNREDLYCEPLLVERADFLSNLKDVKRMYPDVGGVVFFRGMEFCQQAYPSLQEQGIPVCYYGPNIYGAEKPPCNYIYSDENQLAQLMADHLASLGKKRVGLLGKVNQPDDIAAYRLSRFQKAAAGRFEVIPLDCAGGVSVELVKDYPRQMDAVYCTVDLLAIELIQLLERELGFRIPRDLSVMGIDNLAASRLLQPALTTVDLCNYENGKLCIQRFSEYLLKRETSPFTVMGDMKLVVGDSCQ